MHTRTGLQGLMYAHSLRGDQLADNEKHPLKILLINILNGELYGKGQPDKHVD